MTFKIYTIPHTLFAALHLVEQLKKLGHSAELVTEILQEETIYIIYGVPVCKVMPKNYIVYQTEIGTSVWFTKQYLERIKNALCVWDYSEQNVRRYESVNNRIAIVTPGVCEVRDKVVKDIDVLFYGWLASSPRRRNFLQRVIAKLDDAMVVTDLMGKPMCDLLARSKVVINIHFYNNSPLEVFRINEALSHGCHVVSEGPAHNRYKDNVLFVMTPEGMAARAKDCLTTDYKADLSVLCNLGEIRRGLELLTHQTSPADGRYNIEG